MSLLLGTPTRDRPVFLRLSSLWRLAALLALGLFAVLSLHPKVSAPVELQALGGPVTGDTARPPAGAAPIVGIITGEAFADHQDGYAGYSGYVRRGGRPSPHCTGYVAASYVSWIRAAGARAAPLVHTWPQSRVRTTLRQLSGVLLPGGTGSVAYTDAVKFIIEEVAALNRQGAYLPLWGTCLGFEIIVLWSASPSILAGAVGSKNDAETSAGILTKLPAIQRNLRLELTDAGRAGPMFDDAHIPGASRIAGWFETMNISYNEHNYSFPLDRWLANSNVTSRWEVVATSDAGLGPFVTLASGREGWLPFFGSQQHPEKAAGEWSPREPVSHSMEAVQANAHLARYFVAQTRRATQRFETAAVEAEAVAGFYSGQRFTAYNVTTGEEGYFEAIYCFPG